MDEVPEAIQRFLDGVQTGNWDGIENYLTPNVFYDASVPGWHYQYEGRERIAEEFREEWTGKHPWNIVELHVMPTPEGVVLDLEARGRCPGNEHHGPHEKAVRNANIFRLEDGHIAEHRFYCCGEWDEETLQRIEAEAPKVQRAAAVS